MQLYRCADSEAARLVDWGGTWADDEGSEKDTPCSVGYDGGGWAEAGVLGRSMGALGVGIVGGMD